MRNSRFTLVGYKKLGTIFTNLPNASWEEKKIDLLKRYDGTLVNFKAIESPQLLEQPSSDTNDSYITTELDWMFKQQQNVGFQNIS